MSGAVEHILQEVREYRAATDAREKRVESVLSALLRLSRAERIEVIARLAAHQERESSGDGPADVGSAPTAEPATSTPEGVGTLGIRPGTFKAAAATFVFEHPTGVTTQRVATAIGQSYGAAAATLASLEGFVERQGKLWVPTGEPHLERTPEGGTHRDRIIRVIQMSPEPLGVARIYERCRKLKPDTSRNAIQGEVHRMANVAHLIEPVPGVKGPRNSVVYRLTAKGLAMTK